MKNQSIRNGVSEHHLYNGIFTSRDIGIFLDKDKSGRPYFSIRPYFKALIKRDIEIGTTKQAVETFLVDTGADGTIVPQRFAEEKLGFVFSEEPIKIGTAAGGQSIKGYEREVWIYLLNSSISHPEKINIRISNQVSTCILGVDFIHKFIFVYEVNLPYSYTHFYKKD